MDDARPPLPGSTINATDHDELVVGEVPAIPAYPVGLRYPEPPDTATSTWECWHGFCGDCTTNLLDAALRPTGAPCAHSCHTAAARTTGATS